MDKRIADGLARGRVEFRAGKRTAAIATWKEALRVAYETQNQAAAFVLSKSLGDAALESSRKDADGLQDAMGYYDYALQLLTACSLREEHAFYPPLESVVQYVRRRRRRARRLIRELETARRVAPGEELKTSMHEETERVAAAPVLCSTCGTSGTVGNAILVDEADGCFYCQSCYNAYYAEPSGQQDSAIKAAEEKLEDKDVAVDKRFYSAEDLRSLIAVSFQEASTDHATDKAAEIVEPPADSTSDNDGAIAIESSGEAAVAEDSSESVDLTEAARSGQEEIGSFPPAKLQYSIADLKALRRHDLACPSALKHSPVALTNATPPSTHSRNQKPLPRKDKPVHRSTKVHSVRVHDPSPLDASSCLLPSLTECEALHGTMPSLPSPLELAQALFDTPNLSPASSFTTQLQIVTTDCSSARV